MRRAAGAFVVLILAADPACDPAITVHQNQQSARASNSVVFLSVKETHPFIGETWYTTAVTTTNSTRISVTITQVELIAHGVTYKARASEGQPLPIDVPPGTAQSIGVWFDLRENVKETFQSPVELRVLYRSAGKDEVAKAQLSRG